MVLKELFDKFKESQKPENIKKRLTEKIEEEKLRAELDKIKTQRIKNKEQNRPKFKIGM